MSSSGPPDAHASRPRSGILTPTSDGGSHRPRQSREQSLEPRRPNQSGVEAMDQLLKGKISVKPHPPDLHAKPRTLEALMLLPREHLSLSVLDLYSPTGDLPRSRFFESRIKILDLEGRMGTSSSVVVARAEPNGAVYALERQNDGLYVICKLGSWVSIAELAELATAVVWDEVEPAKPRSTRPPAQTAISAPSVYRDHKQKRAAIEAIQSLVRKRPRSASSAQPGVPIKSEGSDSPIPSEAASSVSRAVQEDHQQPLISHGSASTEPTVVQGDTQDELKGQQNADSVLETIRSQYFEAIYKSMGSLAYFAKGPLSRARSTFHLDLEGNLDMATLVDFLKSMVLTTVQIDKKYRDSLPEVLSRPPSIVDSSDDGRRKRKRPRKMKLGKDGLYPSEDEMIQKWWSTYRPELKEDEGSNTTSQIKSFAARLRTRETQLQMILILEIMALEPLKTAEDSSDTMLPDLPGAVNPHGPMAPPPTNRKRSKHNLPVLLDVHADRLTIWQSTSFDEHLWSNETQASNSSRGHLEQKASSEPLKDFCMDVIVPFFSARLPQQCDAINKKLGGPVIISPPKSKSSKHASSHKSQRPGSVTKRQLPAKPERTLQRALSTDLQARRSVSRGPSGAIALMRSASTTALAGIKREASEPLVSIESSDTRQGRGSLGRKGHAINGKDPRAEKKALVEAELRDAISALRKPNREVVSKAMAEADDHKASAAISAKKRKPPRHSTGSSVQVEATPANSRFRNVLAPRSDNNTERPATDLVDLIPPSSVENAVPSTVRKAAQHEAFSDMLSTFTHAADVVGSTPVKASSARNFLRRPADDIVVPPSSPLFARKTAPAHRAQSSNAADAEVGFGLSQCRDVRSFLTPVKKASTNLMIGTPDAVCATPVPIMQEPEKPVERAVSIYDKLGWDNDFDDIL